MLEAIFLGHQGWFIRGDKANLLIDPLLDEQFGARAEARMKVYPPRLIDLDRLPKVDAVFISHEHEDHFQIQSLHKLSRSTRILLSGRSSWAAEKILTEMGFPVTRVQSEDVLNVGDITLNVFGAEFNSDRPVDMEEWDVLTYAVSNASSDGIFFSGVDVDIPETALAWLKKVGGATVATFTNNLSSVHEYRSWSDPPPGPLAVIDAIGSDYKRYWAKLPRPKLVVATGGGWSFSDELESLNRSFFPADSFSVDKAIAASGMREFLPFSAPVPGTVIRMQGGEVSRSEPAPDSFLKCVPPERWPRRSFSASREKVADIPPLVPGGDFSLDHLPLLQERLADLARHLVGGRFFLRLMSLSKEQLSGKRRGYALVVSIPGHEGLTFEYLPEASAFVATTNDASEYAAGGGCWASDLLALLEGQITAAAFTFGRFFEWANCPIAQPGVLSLSEALWKMMHPLRYPERFCRAYRRQLELASTDAVTSAPLPRRALGNAR